MQNNPDFRVYKRLLRQAQPYRFYLAGVLLLSLLEAPLTLLLPVPMKIAVDSVIGTHEPPLIIRWLTPDRLSDSPGFLLFVIAALLISVTLLLYAQSLVAWIVQTYTGEKLLLEFRAALFRHVQRLSLSYHDARGTTDSLYRIQYDTTSVQNITINTSLPLISSASTLIGMVAVTASIDRQLALVALAVCPLLYILTRMFGSRLRDRWREVKQYESSAMGVVQEALGALRVIKAFGTEQYEHERFITRSRDYLRGQIALARLQGSFDLGIGVTIACGSAAALIIGVRDVTAGRITVGNLLLVTAYIAQIYTPLKTITKKIADLQSALAGAGRAFALLDELPEVNERQHSRPITRALGAVEFRNVCFRYPDGPMALRDVSFSIKTGARVGIAGRTGAGKSTLMTLLTRFYDPVSGEILLDGIDLREYSLADLRRQFAIVLQDPVLFSTTIAENIAYANPRATEREIMAAAKLANAHDFIMGLPDGYRTEVGERGMRLSGGERQRVSLARAFLKDAAILILDEPTSSVDVKTEAVIVQAMERLMKGRTTFMIAHRLSTLEACDLLLEVEGGRITVHSTAQVRMLN